MLTKVRKTCRVCGSKELKEIFSFGSLSLSAFLDKPTKTQKVPLELIECQDCTLLQLRHTAPFQKMYTEQYWYKSGVNPVIENDLKDIVDMAIHVAKPKRGDLFLDIGANDGTLLKYVPKKFVRWGVEPAKNLAEDCIRYCDMFNGCFWEDFKGSSKAKVITAIGMFYDSEDPNKFIKKVKEYLQEDGLFIAQMMTLYPMLMNNDLGNVCHEHLEFYNYKSLVRLFEQNGLEIFKVEENKINGGSYRLYARHFKNGSVKHNEPKLSLKDWIRRLEKNRRETVSFVEMSVRGNLKVYVYGASTKSSTILQWYGLDSKKISGAADRNPAKWGKYQAGTNIKVVSEEEARKEAHVFLVMPYGFRDHFIKREKQWLKNNVMAFCTPKFEVI